MLDLAGRVSDGKMKPTSFSDRAYPDWGDAEAAGASGREAPGNVHQAAGNLS